MAKKKCPKCGAEEFYVTAHVAQDWKVNGNGEFLDCVEDCVETTHYPNDTDIWECANCLYSDEGSAFNVD